MFKSFFSSRRWLLWAYGGGLLLVVSLWIQVSLSVLINDWYGRFYDLLQNASQYQDNPQEGIALFYDQLISLSALFGSGEASFLLLAMPYTLIATITAWFTRIYAFRWREAITFYYLPAWRGVTEEIEGASQRIQEDCARFARIVETLGLQVVRAIMTLIAFLPVLWRLSASVQVSGLRDVHGSLVWVALACALGGIVISWFVGIMLPGLEYNNQKVEARFRKDLVLAEDDKAHYAQLGKLTRLFDDLKFNYHRLFLHYGYFDIWQYAYGQFMVVLPFLLIGPSLFMGLIKLGTVIQVSNAFDKVHGSFDLFLQNWTTITELRSIVKRLSEFEANLRLQGQHLG